MTLYLEAGSSRGTLQQRIYMLVLNKNDTVSQPPLVHPEGCAIQICLMTPADPKHVFLLLKSFST